MSWWETLHLVTWWKRLGISAIKTGQDDPSWIWCTERLSFFGGGHIVLQRFVHVRCHFQPLPTKLVFAYFDRGSYIDDQTQSVACWWYSIRTFVLADFTTKVLAMLSWNPAKSWCIPIRQGPTTEYHSHNGTWGWGPRTRPQTVYGFGMATNGVFQRFVFQQWLFVASLDFDFFFTIW